jgi:hypothetical protein
VSPKERPLRLRQVLESRLTVRGIPDRVTGYPICTAVSTVATWYRPQSRLDISESAGPVLTITHSDRRFDGGVLSLFNLNPVPVSFSMDKLY